MAFYINQQLDTNKLIIVLEYLPRVLVELTGEYLVDWNYPDCILEGNHIQFWDQHARGRTRFAIKQGIIIKVSEEKRNKYLIIKDDETWNEVRLETPYDCIVSYCKCPANTHN